MGKAYFVGIDTGTNSSKGALIDEQGEILALHSTEHSMENPQPGYYEHDAERDWWGDFCTISRELLRKSGVDAKDVKAVGISALGADCVPVDEHCRPLRKAILYGIDARATDEMAELTALYGEEQILKWYGRPLCSSDVMPKILWIKRREPEVYARTHKFLTGSSYITAKLTGRYVVDRFLGLASFNPLYDPQTRKPVPEYCAPVCRPDQLAEILEAAEVAGTVTAEAAAETGLSEGTPVITGTDDSGAEAISCGVVESGKMMLQLGSSVYMILGTDSLIDDERLWREEFIVPGLCDISAGTNTAGSLTKWFRDELFPDALAAERAGGENAYQRMLEGVAEIPPGADQRPRRPRRALRPDAAAYACASLPQRAGGGRLFRQSADPHHGVAPRGAYRPDHRRRRRRAESDLDADYRRHSRQGDLNAAGDGRRLLRRRANGSARRGV